MSNLTEYLTANGAKISSDNRAVATYVDNALRPGERVLAAVSAMESITHNGFAVVTDQRLLIALSRRGGVFSTLRIDMAEHQFRAFSFTVERKMLTRSFTVATSGRDRTTYKVIDPKADEFFQVLSAQQAAPTAPVAVAVAAPARDLSARLADLAALHAAGALSDDEFAQGKAAILAGG